MNRAPIAPSAYLRQHIRQGGVADRHSKNNKDCSDAGGRDKRGSSFLSRNADARGRGGATAVIALVPDCPECVRSLAGRLSRLRGTVRESTFRAFSHGTGEVPYRLETSARLKGAPALNYGAQRGRHNRFIHECHPIGIPRLKPRKHESQQPRCSINVRALIDRREPILLGRRKPVGSKVRSLRRGLGSKRPRDAQIDEMRSIGSQKNVSRRYIAVRNTAAMELLNCLAHFKRNARTAPETGRRPCALTTS